MKPDDYQETYVEPDTTDKYGERGLCGWRFPFPQLPYTDRTHYRSAAVHAKIARD